MNALRLPARTCSVHTTRCTLDVRTEPKTLPTEKKTKWDGMTLHFVSLEVTVGGRNSEQLRQHVEESLEKEGEPVRWAIVDSNEETGTCRVDAVVSK